MFPNQIEEVALVAIKYSEWNTLNWLLKELSYWMVSPDLQTAKCVGHIASSLYDHVKGLSIYNDYVNVLSTMFKYSVNTLQLK